MAQIKYNFLVKSGLSTKAISLESNDVGSITDAVRKTFKVSSESNIRLKAYSTEWQDYVDIDDNEESKIENKGKIEAIVTSEVDLQSLFDTSSYCERQIEGSVDLFSSQSTSKSSDDQASIITGYVPGLAGKYCAVNTALLILTKTGNSGKKKKKKELFLEC